MTNTILPELTEYNENELELAQNLSSAVERYLRLLNSTPTDDYSILRIERHRAWLKCALATLLNKASAQTICQYWSEETDRIIELAWHISSCYKHDLAIYGLGKWGAKELNLSSDIDLVFISEGNPTAEQLKAVRKFINLLAETTGLGFAYRVDTDLKPGGRLAPLISSIKQFEDYYWSAGETWERLALVRLRFICGKSEIQNQIQFITDKFVYRKFIDYSLFEDLKRLRTKIHSHYQHNDTNRINLKLAPGCIRDIELFIHALQITNGGKNAELKIQSTTDACARLISSNRFDKNDLQTLIDSYWQFRKFENYVQAREDRQTHDWTVAFGQKEFDTITTIAKNVEKIVEPILGKSESIPTLPSTDKERQTWLAELGYSPQGSFDNLNALLSLTALSTKTIQDEELRLKILRQFIEELAKVAIDKDLGLALLIDFFRSTRAKSTFFSLLAHESRLIKELSFLFGCSPYLGGLIAARPELLDSYLYRAQASHNMNFDVLLENLAERKLINEIICATGFLQNKNLNHLCTSLSSGADDICATLLQALKNEHGASSIDVLALGKWGGEEMGLRSDLDFIFITPDTPAEIDHKIAKRFIARLTEQHRGGSIYDIDMRLRPTGKAGPILVSVKDLQHYLLTTADVWERQSYLRSRTITDNSFLNSDLIKKSCLRGPLQANELKALSEIRLQLLKLNADIADLKYSPGGLIDIEFATQIAFLDLQQCTESSTGGMINSLMLLNQDWHQLGPRLFKNYVELRTIEQFYQLLNQHPVSELKRSSEPFSRLAKAFNTPQEELMSHVSQLFKENCAILLTLDPRQRGN